MTVGTVGSLTVGVKADHRLAQEGRTGRFSDGTLLSPIWSQVHRTNGDGHTGTVPDSSVSFHGRFLLREQACSCMETPTAAARLPAQMPTSKPDGYRHRIWLVMQLDILVREGDRRATTWSRV